MTSNLKRLAVIFGLLLLGASMVFSYMGFNFNFDAEKVGDAVIVFKVIAIVLTVVVALIQMIFSTDFRNLNATLIAAGVMSYVYSIWTNYSGLKPFVGIDSDDTLTWIIAAFLDGLPEPMIAWGMGESLKGDFLGNLWRIAFPSQPGKTEQKQENKSDKHHQPAHFQPHSNPKKPEYRPANKPTRYPSDMKKPIIPPKYFED